jgi:Fe-S cluster assembly protein SufD
MLGAYLPTGEERVAHYTTVDHRVPNCTSDEDYRGVLYDRAQGVFNGKIFVRPDAQKTEAYQRNANLVVGREAVMHSKPELEIYADDVKCSHGCTIGQIDDQALFYAQSRGIAEADARALLVEAFVGDVLRALPEGGVQEAVRKGWAARHGGFDNGEGWSDWTD